METRQNLLALGLLCLACVGDSHQGYAATLGFKPPATYPVGTSPFALASGDFNGDGKPDLVIADYGDPSANDDGGVSILLGNGDGTFQPANTITAGKHPISVAAADFNMDGRLDLVVDNYGDFNAGNGGSVSVLLGNGDGTFQSAKSFTLPGVVPSLAVGDFDSDLRPDLAVVHGSSSATLTVFLGNGDGTFGSGDDVLTNIPVVFLIGSGAVLVADLNSDHKADVVVGHAFGLHVLVGNGDGTFQPAWNLPVTGPNDVRPTSAADFNQDGKLDLLIAVIHLVDGNISGLVEVLPGSGDGTFQAANTVTSDVESLFPATGDFDGDGNPDLAVTNGFLLRVDVYLGNGDGTFRLPVSFDTNSLLGWILVVDLNADQAPDLVTTNGSQNTITVLLNATGADFSIVASAPTPGTVSRGQSSTSTVTLNHLNAFENPVTLTCSVQPAQSAPACSLNPNSVTFDANGNATTTLTINTAAATASLVPHAQPRTPFPFPFLWLPVAGFALLAAGFGSSYSFKRKLVMFFVGGVLFGGLILQAACGGGSAGSSGPQSTTYTITITGTSGSTQRSTTTALTVQ